MTRVSGRGPWPGDDVLEAQTAVLGTLTDTPYGVTGVPFLPVLAERGPGAEPVGRSAALLVDMPVELGPHGWKLSDASGMDLDRARAFLREDLDTLAVAAYGYSGPLTVQVTGPWTLAATLYLARGDRVLSDRGAVRELGLSLAAGVVEHLAALRAQVPGAQVTVQVSETLLGQVAAGVLPTFSGYSRLRAVSGPDLVEGLRPFLDALRAADAPGVVHLGSAWVGVPAAVHAGADAIGMDLSPVGAGWNEHGWECVARAVEAGVGFWASLPRPTVSQCAGADVGSLVDVLRTPWLRMGLPTSGLDDVVLVGSDEAPGGSLGTSRGPVGAGSVQDARGALSTLVRVGALLAEHAAG